MSSLTRQRILMLIALLSYAGVGAALISQHSFDMMPCAWCVLQRLIYLILGTVCLIGALGSPSVARVTSALAIPISVGGILAAWYQFSVAAEMESCDRTFADRFMVRSGLDSGLPSLFGIFGTCMEARVKLFGVEYALWSLALFALFAVMAIVALRRKS